VYHTRHLYTIFRGITHATIKASALDDPATHRACVAQNLSFSSDNMWLAVSSSKTTRERVDSCSHIQRAFSFADLYALNPTGGPVSAATHHPALLSGNRARLVSVLEVKRCCLPADASGSIADELRDPVMVNLSSVHRERHSKTVSYTPKMKPASYTSLISVFLRLTSDSSGSARAGVFALMLFLAVCQVGSSPLRQLVRSAVRLRADSQAASWFESVACLARSSSHSADYKSGTAAHTAIELDSKTLQSWDLAGSHAKCVWRSSHITSC